MSSVLIYQPLGLGDHIACHGIVRQYAKKHDLVGLFCSPQNIPSVSFMFRDLPHVRIIPLTSHKEVRWFRIKNFFHLYTPHFDSLVAVGSFDSESGVKYERQFYNSAHVPFEKLWENFSVERSYETESSLFKKLAPEGPYAFVHEDTRFPLAKGKLPVDMPIVRPDLSLTKNVFDYCLLLERAQEIHVMDSSFMFLVDCLPYSNPMQRLVVHRYARENLAWNLPILKKNWEILL